jgi:poly(3-hydroxybutyrate) depolymerase
MAANATQTRNFGLTVVSAVGTIADRASIADSLGADPNNTDNLAALDLRATDPTTTTVIGNNTLRSVNLGPDRTSLYTNEPAGTLPNIARMIVPQNYTGAEEIPVVMMLHGLDSSANNISGQFGHRFATGTSLRNYFLILPNGTRGPRNRPHWNATDACCNTHAGSPNRDDVGYLRDLIIEAQQLYRVDPRRVYVMGYSNGGFMSYRLACEIPHLLTGIVPMAGATFQNESSCVQSAPVSVLHVHGTADASARFYDYAADPDNDPATPLIPDNPNVPGAVQSLSRFATKAGCDLAQLVTRPTNINLWHPHTESGMYAPRGTIGTGDETIQRGFDASCATGFDFDLWEIQLATHGVWFEYQLNLISDGIFPSDRILNWMFTHTR